MSLDVFGVERFKSARSFDHRRRQDRRGCDLSAALATSHGEVRARIVDISAGGIGFVLDPVLGLKAGEKVTVRQETLGEFRCVVQWALHPRYGAAFEPGASPSRAVCAFYDSLPAG